MTHFVADEVTRFDLGPIGATGHGGGDAGLMAAFVRAVRDRSRAMTTARESLESHVMVCAAEEARAHKCVVHMDAFRHQAESITDATQGRQEKSY
jgi:hypothetical protein